KLSGSTQFEILFRHHETVIGFFHDFQTLASCFRVCVGNQEAIGLIAASSDPASQLVQLCKSEAIRIFDDHDGCIGNVDTDFDNGCTNQYIEFALAKLIHNFF